MIVVVCPGCHRRLQLADAAGGHEGKCAHCGKHVRLGGPPPPEPAPPEPDLGANDTASSPAPETGAHPPVSPRAVAPGYEFLSPPRQPDELGRLGDYRVLQLLGQGAMGMVFRAEDTVLGRTIALKVMLPSVAASPENRERFKREAQATALVNHPNVIAIYKIGEDRGVPYLAMPLLKGESLEARLSREGRLTVPHAARIAGEIAEGLAAAHARNLIHRDIKPANLWLEPVQRRSAADRVKILDFGLARIGDAGLTTPGAVLGTPAYMAPEQAKGIPVDYRCDLFSLGSVLYRMLTGERAFRGNEVFAVLMALTTAQPPPPHEVNPAVPEALSRLVMHLLAKEPGDRPQSAGEVVDALNRMGLVSRSGSTDKLPVYRPPPSGAVPAVSVHGGAGAASDTLPEPKPAGASRPGPVVRSLLVAAGAILLFLLGATAFVARDLFVGRARGTLLLDVRPSDSKAFVDSRAVELDAAGMAALTLSPGRHELRASHPGYEDGTRPLEVTEGDNAPVKIELKRLPDAGDGPKVSATTDGPPKAGGTDGAKGPSTKAEAPKEPRRPPTDEGISPPPRERASVPPPKQESIPPPRAAPPKPPVITPPAETVKAKVAPPRESPPAETAPVTPPPKAIPVPADRRAAEWVLDCGGEVILKVPGKATPDRVRRKAELPQARFDVVMVDLDDRRSADDTGLAALEGLKELSSLNLSGTGVTDAGAAVLGRLSGLKILALRKTRITDRAVRQLKELESLRDLDLQDTKVSPAGVEQLRTALPACHITPP